MNTCYIVDDEQHCIDVIARHIKATPGLELIGTELDPMLALQQFSEHAITPDITFLDVQMPGITGIALAELIKSSSTQIVFTTAYPEYAASAFEKDAVDYLLKPVFYERFYKAITKAKEQIALRKLSVNHENINDFIFIKGDAKGKVARINIDDIIYIESKLNYICIKTEKEEHITYASMKDIEAKLAGKEFIRAHKSYMINLSKIKAVQLGNVLFSNGEQITIGRSYRQKFIDAINERMLNGMNK